MTIYQRIKELANEKNISIRELESELKFSNGTMSKWKESATSEKLQTVADYFNVTVDYLLGNKKNSNLNKPKEVDIDDEHVILRYQGKQIPDEDMEIIKRLLRGK
ncbi:helix-turn-helix domain-containing protein [Loigolactobacillus zhaoyuanensis]|uniref:Helix-turn-helix domain-containing protein n=1 Tax=Loigolactobacillus zhaoyuanensis TaxID=2486017 RepID=A0ABW8U8B7_9LACO